MNTFKKIQLLLLVIVGLVTTKSCVQDDEFATPPIVCSDRWNPTLTIPELFTKVNTANTILSFEDEEVFEGYVISSDSTGNFFKTISIQDSPVNPTRGLQVEIDRTNSFNNFPLGSKVRINLKNIYAGYDRGTLKVGETYESNGVVRVGRMAEAIVDNHVSKTCDDFVTITPAVYENIEDAVASSNNINTLITIKNVQFEANQLGETYADAVGLATVNRYLEDADGNRVVLRNSGFADFADELLPEGNGSITAVLSAYDTNNDGNIAPSEYQLFIRDTNDVKFDQPRFGEGGGGSGSGEGPIGGGEALNNVCLNEDFESYDADTKNLSAYENYAFNGGRYWSVNSFNGNKYIQMSAFNSTDASNTTYFIVPVNFSEADNFSFKTKDGYNNGDVLTVHYSTDYQIGGDLSTATLTDITSSFNIATGSTSGYAQNFTESGDYDLSNLTGNGVILFKYQGGGGVTTTFQIDDIKITDTEDSDCGNTGGGSSGGIGGDQATFDACLAEPFTTYADNNNNFPKYENYALEGSRHWQAKSYEENKYIQMSAFNSTDANNKVYFIVPVNFSEADSFSFKTKDGYNNGGSLKVYYTTNYTIGGDIATATLTDITSQFTISTGNASGYAQNFTDSGAYDLSGLSGNGYIVFMYDGSANGITTTMQIDDITIVNNEDPNCMGNGVTTGG